MAFQILSYNPSGLFLGLATFLFVWYYIFLTTIIIRLRITKKIDLIGSVIGWILWLALYALFLWCILWVVLLIRPDLSSNPISVGGFLISSGQLLIGMLFLFAFICAFIVPLDDVESNYESELQKTIIKGTKAGIVGGTTAVVGGNISKNTAMKDVGQAVQAAGVTLGMVALLNILSFKSFPWKYLKTIVVSLFVLFIILGLLMWELSRR